MIENVVSRYSMISSRTRVAAAVVAVVTAMTVTGCASDPEEPSEQAVTTRTDGDVPTVESSGTSTESAVDQTTRHESSESERPEHDDAVSGAEPVDVGTVLGPLTDKEPGSGPAEKVSRDFTSNMENYGLSNFRVNFWDQGQQSLLEYPVEKKGRIAWNVRDANDKEAVSCRVTLRVKDSEGKFLGGDVPKYQESEICKSYYGHQFSFSEEGDYTMVLTLEIPGDTPPLTVEQPFRVVDF